LTILFTAIVSFRSIPRILQLFLSEGEWVPHFTSVINWSLQLGLSLLKFVAPIDEPWLAIIDNSIDIGTKKALVVLRVRLSSLSERGSAITLEDCECIGLKINEISDGKAIAEALEEAFSYAGSPIAILKDGGSDLKKGVELLNENRRLKIESIDDVGHSFANALKAYFGKNFMFNKFLELVNCFSRQLRQTNLAFLVPPKIRTKGRYQSLLKLAEWAVLIINFIKKTDDSFEYKKVRDIFSSLPFLKNIIEEFVNAVEESSRILKILKNEGFTKETIKEITPIVDGIENKKIKEAISSWITKHLEIYNRLELNSLPMIVSSDAIESLFGRFKNIQSRGSIKDMNRSALLIPALCGSIRPELINIFLKETKLEEVEEWDCLNISYTQNEKKRKFIQENTNQKSRESSKLYSYAA